VKIPYTTIVQVVKGLREPIIVGTSYRKYRIKLDLKLNMAILHGRGIAIGLVAQPLLLRWNGCRWEPKRAMNTQRSKNPPLQ